MQLQTENSFTTRLNLICCGNEKSQTLAGLAQLFPAPFCYGQLAVVATLKFTQNGVFFWLGSKVQAR